MVGKKFKTIIIPAEPKERIKLLPDCETCNETMREVLTNLPAGQYRIGYHCTNCEKLKITSETLEIIEKENQTLWQY